MMDEDFIEEMKENAVEIGDPISNPDDRDRIIANVKEWDVIWGWDTEDAEAPDMLAILYGVEMLEGIVKHAESVPLSIGCVKYSSTDDLERILGVIVAVKGSHCYKSE